MPGPLPASCFWEASLQHHKFISIFLEFSVFKKHKCKYPKLLLNKMYLEEARARQRSDRLCRGNSKVTHTFSWTHDKSSQAFRVLVSKVFQLCQIPGQTFILLRINVLLQARRNGAHYRNCSGGRQECTEVTQGKTNCENPILLYLGYQGIRVQIRKGAFSGPRAQVLADRETAGQEHLCSTGGNCTAIPEGCWSPFTEDFTGSDWALSRCSN